MSISECVEKRKDSNYYKWKHKDMSMVSYHTGAEVKKKLNWDQQNITRLFLTSITFNSGAVRNTEPIYLDPLSHKEKDEA